MAPPLLLGIDTGGTYTDAVLLDAARGVVAKAKALTTRHDLSEGIAGAVGAVLKRAAVEPGAIGLVSLSTTLATNALVEGQGTPAGLVMIGFEPGDLARDGLGAALGTDPVIFVPGGHDVHGEARPLDLKALHEGLDAAANRVSAFAVAGYFAVRNPAHEIAVRDAIRVATGLPVTCSHELSSRLGGPRRALTALLNARLVGLIDRLIGACSDYLGARGIAAPLMVVRGDGALIAAEEARLRPIETILSGPAASLVGARHLTGLSDAVVSDIGGTTTDIAILEEGRPRLDPEGAMVGGHRTMVEAVAMRTFGLGGDSEVHVGGEGLAARITLGPRRVVPLSLAAHLHGDAVIGVLDAQLRAPYRGRLDGRFAMLTGVDARLAATLPAQERALMAALDRTPLALDKVLTSARQRATLDRLVARGIAQIVAMTPSDALHVLGRQAHWNTAAARLGAELIATRRDGAGQAVAADATAVAEAIVVRLTRQSAEAVLQSCLPESSPPGAFGPEAGGPVDRALTRAPGVVRFGLSLDRPLVGLGAAAPLTYPAIAAMLGAEAAIPADADVANAIGAVVGQVSAAVTVTVTRATAEGTFLASGAGAARACGSEAEALALAERLAGDGARAAAARNGVPDAAVTWRTEIVAPDVDGVRQFVEARITATATGRPRIASA